jgi:ribosomal protein L32
MGFFKSLGKALENSAEKQKEKERLEKIAKQTEEERLDALRAEYFAAGFKEGGFGNSERQIRVRKDLSEPNAPPSKRKDLRVDIDVCSSETAAENMLTRFSGEGLPSRYMRIGRTVAYVSILIAVNSHLENEQTRDALAIFTNFMASLPAPAAPAAAGSGGEASTISTCPGCGTTVAPDATFCPGCGQRVRSDRTCLKCGKTDNSGAMFCSSCGNRLG